MSKQAFLGPDGDVIKTEGSGSVVITINGATALDYEQVEAAEAAYDVQVKADEDALKAATDASLAETIPLLQSIAEKLKTNGGMTDDEVALLMGLAKETLGLTES